MELGACHECASGSNLAFHVDFVHKFIAYEFFAERGGFQGLWIIRVLLHFVQTQHRLT
jgi:hypothetical protein